MQTGQKIAELRKNAGLTQEQLADRLFVSRDLVSKWENGKRRPDAGSLENAARLFSVDVGELRENSGELEKELSDCIPAGYSSSKELPAQLNAFLGTLNERDRSVFIRRYYFYENAAAIGEKYGISAAHVRTVLGRARKKLRLFFTEEKQ